MLKEDDNKKWKSKFNRVRRDWRNFNDPVIHDHPGNPFYPFIRPSSPYGVPGSVPEGLDPPGHFQINRNNTRPTVWQPEVLSHKDQLIRYILLNRPTALHSLNLPAVRTLIPLLKKWDKQLITTTAIFLTSSSGDHLCAGTDFIDIYNALRNGDKNYARTFFKELYQLMLTINTLEKPYLPIMHGYTMGSGAGLVFNSDSFRISTEDAIFAMPEVGMGFVPDCGATHFLAQLPNEVGTFLALTGKRMRGWDLLHSGIATHIVPHGQLGVMLENLSQIVRPDVGSVMLVEMLYANCSQPREHPYLFEKRGYLDIVKRCFNKDTVQEIMDALEHEFDPWAHEVLKTMKENCPLSMAVTLQLIRKGKNSSLSDAMDAEYRAAVRLVEMPDFQEGVRARLIEKRNPRWSHANVSQVTQEEVDRLLAPLPQTEELDAVVYSAPYVRRMAAIEDFVNVSFSELCYFNLKNKLMNLTDLREERYIALTNIATELRAAAKKNLEEELAQIDKHIEEQEAIDPEKVTEEQEVLLKDMRSKLEFLARGKVTLEEYKSEIADLYKRWAVASSPKLVVIEKKPVEQDKEVYGWSKFFKKEGDTAPTVKLGERLGDRLAEKLKVASMGADGKPASPFAPKNLPGKPSLADKLFGTKSQPATSSAASTTTASNAMEGTTETKSGPSLTESLLAAVSKQSSTAPPEEEMTAVMDDDRWKAFEESWRVWALPLFPAVGPSERNIIDTQESIGQEKFDAWINERMETPSERAKKFRKATDWKIDLDAVEAEIDGDNIIEDRGMAIHMSHYRHISRPFIDPQISYFYDASMFYFRDRIQDPLSKLGQDLAWNMYGRAGELSTWKDRIKLTESFVRKRGEIWGQTGYTPDDALEFLADCAEETEAVPERFRHVKDIDLVVARALKGWIFKDMDLPQQIHLDDAEEDPIELLDRDAISLLRDGPDIADLGDEEGDFDDEYLGGSTGEEDVDFDDDDDGAGEVDMLDVDDDEDGDDSDEGDGDF